MRIVKKSTVSGISTNPSSSGVEVSAVVALEKAMKAGITATVSSGGGTSSGVIACASSADLEYLEADPESVFSLYWDGGHRHLVGVDSGTWNALYISGGTGNNLPANGTSIVLAKLERCQYIDWSVANVNAQVVFFQFGSSLVGDGPVSYRFVDSSLGQGLNTDWKTLKADQLIDLCRDLPEDTGGDPTWEEFFANFIVEPLPRIAAIEWTNGYLSEGTMKYVQTQTDG